MSVCDIAFVLYRPHDDEGPDWQQFKNIEFKESVGKDGSYTSTALYRMIDNPMGRPPPDDKTYFGIYSLEKLGDGESGEHLFASKQPRFAETEVRTYSLLEHFDPRGLGTFTTPAPCVLQAETIPTNVQEFQDFYRVDHAVMMSKHPGYRRTSLYQLRSVVKPAKSGAEPASILIFHEFDNFEGLGGPITKASTETPLAKKVFGGVQSMISRALKLESTGSVM